jgi:hypothetical protein
MKNPNVKSWVGMPTKTKHGCFAKQELFVVEIPLKPLPFKQSQAGRLRRVKGQWRR